MPKTRDLIERIQALYNHGTRSTSSRLSNRHVYSVLMSIRKDLITNKLNKRQKISQWNYQTIPCIELIAAPISECKCAPGMTVLRTKYKLPKPLTGIDSHVIQSFTSVDGTVTFDETTWEANRYSKGNKFTANKPDFLIRNGYGYITVKTFQEVGTITGLWDDPAEVEKFPSYCCDVDSSIDCLSPLDMEFPIDGDMEGTLIELATKELVDWFSRTPEDKFNDSTDNNSLAKR